MPATYSLSFVDHSAYRTGPGRPPRPHGCVAVDGYRVFQAHGACPPGTTANRAMEQHRAQLAERIEAIHALLAAMRRDGECDNGRPHVASKQALRLRLELVGLMVEHRSMRDGNRHTMPKALVLARELDDYEPSAATITHICYWYRLCPLWLLMGRGEPPRQIEGRL